MMMIMTVTNHGDNGKKGKDSDNNGDESDDKYNDTYHNS